MTAKSKISCLILVCFLAWYAVVYILASWLVCQCGGWKFRWIYPLTAFLVIEILKGLFRGHHSGESMKNLLDGLDDKLKETKSEHGKNASPAAEEALDGHPFTVSELSEKLKKDVPWVVDWMTKHKIAAMPNNDGIEASYLEPQYMLTDEEYAKISKDAEE